MPENFADNIRQIRQETGARMVTVGEEHITVNTIQYMRDSLPALKSGGINTLYIEVPSDSQPLIDKAIQGDPDSQRDLRLKYEHWFGGYAGSEVAQQRYDLIFDANKAGLRVKCADADKFNDSIQPYIGFGKDSQVSDGFEGDVRTRMAISNPVFARNIKQMDDGKGAILLIGLGHTFRSGGDEHNETMGGKQVKFYNSPVGGVDQQLNDLGIATASADFRRQNDPAFKLQRTSGDNSADYYIDTPPDQRASTDPSGMTTATYRVAWDRMATLFERAGIQAEVNGKPKDAKLCQDAADKLSALPRLLDDPQFVRQSPEAQQHLLAREIENARPTIEKGIDGIPRLLEAQAAVSMYDRWTLAALDQDTRKAEIAAIIETNQDIHLSGAEQMWRRDPMPLAGEKTGLSREWQKAQNISATSQPEDRRPNPAPVPTPAPAL